jgi:hypothetical protein
MASFLKPRRRGTNVRPMNPFDFADVTYDRLGVPRRTSNYSGEKDCRHQDQEMESYHMVHPFFTFHLKFSSAAWCDARIFNIGDSIPLHE